MSTKGSVRKKSKVKGQDEVLTREEFETQDLEARIALIQALIPLGLMAAAEELQREVANLVGGRYGHGSKGSLKRHGSNPGTVLLGGQKIPIKVPRVRGTNGDVPLRSYDLLHNGVPGRILEEVLGGLSCRRHETVIQPQKGSIGTSKSSVSRRIVSASNNNLEEIQGRSLGGIDVSAVFIDGKYFVDDQMVIALGVDSSGVKRILGFVQTETENKAALTDFLRKLVARGLKTDKGLLVIVDGSKGIRAAVKAVFGSKALVQRCQWHKRENVVSYLPKAEQGWYRQRLQNAYEQPTYEAARAALKVLSDELQDVNQSAAASLEEGLEETLTLHKLEVYPLIGKSFKTTNCIESVNSAVEELCGRVDSWKNSSQKHRWLALALTDLEPKLNRIRGSKHLGALRAAVQKKLGIDTATEVALQ